MADESAGLLVWRLTASGPEFLLAHPGGPFWVRRDAGAWTLPKGRLDPGEAPLAAAHREFLEETGLAVDGEFAALTPRKQPGGKIIHAWAVQADLDLARFASNRFEIEWPPRSGQRRAYPEIDRIAYFDAATATAKLSPGQRPFLAETFPLAAQASDHARHRRGES